MPIVQYTCDTCKRVIELPENKKGMEIVRRCIITDGCKGKLDRSDYKPAYTAGTPPPDVAGLTNWIQRKILYTHEQTLSSTQWRIVHDLNTIPSTQTYVKRLTAGGGTELVEIQPTSIDIISNNEILINFSLSQTGTAQCIARSSSIGQKITTLEEKIETTTDEIIQITNQTELTIATLSSTFSNESDMILNIEFLSSDTLELIHSESVVFDTTPDFQSPWRDYKDVLINGKVYHVRSTDIDFNNIVSNKVKNYSPFYFTLDGNTSNNNEVFILLATPPYDKFDKDPNNLIDISSVISSTAAVSYYYNQNELYAYDNIKEKVFPLIRPVG